MSALFLTITISVSHNWERADQRAHIRERIAVDSQHQICIPPQNFYFCTRLGIDLQKSERIFLLTLKTPACPWKSAGICHQNWAKIPQFWAKIYSIGQNSLQVKDRKLEMTYLHLHFAFVLQISNWEEINFLLKISGVFPVFSPFVTEIYIIYSLLIMENIMFKSFVWLPAHLILCRSFDVLISGSTLYVPTTPIQLSQPIK